MKNNLIIKITITILITLGLFTIWYLLNQSNKTNDISSNKNRDLSGKKVVFLAVNTDIEAAKLLSQWFNEETGAVVQVKENSYDKMVDGFLDDYNSPTPQVDVVDIWQPTIAKLVENKAVLDLTDLLEANKETIKVNDFFPKIYDAYSLYKGRRWAIPFDVDTHFLFYRKSLLQKHRLNPPKTWSDVLNIAKVITEKESKNGIYGYAMMGWPVPVLLISSYVNRLSAYGGEFIDENGIPKLNTPQAIEALQAMIDIYPYSLPTPTQTDYEISMDSFLTGRVAMVDQFTNVGVSANSPEFSSIIDDWGLVQMPSSKPSQTSIASLNGGFSLAISRKAPNPEVAKAFLLFVARPDIQKKLALSNTGMDPGRISVVQCDEFKEMTPKVAKATEESFKGDIFSWPVHPQMMEMMQILTVSITDALEGRKTAKEAIVDTHNQWLKLLNSSDTKQ
jgi:multiple sugar transport system substrate-binding protein